MWFVPVPLPCQPLARRHYLQPGKIGDRQARPMAGRLPAGIQQRHLARPGNRDALAHREQPALHIRGVDRDLDDAGKRLIDRLRHPSGGSQVLRPRSGTCKDRGADAR